MINALGNENYLSFEGYINITLYPFGSNKVYTTYSTVVKTALDGEYWYAEYENGESMTKLGVYYKEHNGYACQVGLNFMNEEQCMCYITYAVPKSMLPRVMTSESQNLLA